MTCVHVGTGYAPVLVPTYLQVTRTESDMATANDLIPSSPPCTVHACAQSIGRRAELLNYRPGKSTGFRQAPPPPVSTFEPASTTSARTCGNGALYLGRFRLRYGLFIAVIMSTTVASAEIQMNADSAISQNRFWATCPWDYMDYMTYSPWNYDFILKVER